VKLAFSTNAYKKVSLEEAIESIGRLGYAGVEIMADVPHAYPPEMPAERIQRVRERMVLSGLRLSNVNAFTLFALGDTYHPSWIDADPARRSLRIEHTLNAIRMTSGLVMGARSESRKPTISLEPGGPLAPGESRQLALDHYEAGLRACLPLAEEMGVTLLVEPEPGLLIEHAQDCVAFLERVQHPNLRMNCDLGHFFCVNEDPAAVVRQCADWIEHVHLEDIAATRVHQHLIPGHGAMDWTSIFTALRDINYLGWVTVELYPYETTAEEAARKAFEFLRSYV
jgi:sugar phosphate isomerase/epimerase